MTFYFDSRTAAHEFAANYRGAIVVQLSLAGNTGDYSHRVDVPASELLRKLEIDSHGRLV